MDFRAILTALEDADVRYVLVGGVAAVLHGVPVNTFDIDIVPAREPENAGRLAVALRGLDACYRQHLPKRLEPIARDLMLPGHHLLMTRCGPLDVLGEIVGGRSYPDLVVHAPRADLHDGLRVQVLDLAELVAIKRLLTRTKDRAQLADYERTLEERRARGG
ncbi:MAG: hypothetical protein HZA52_06395 [Planctomycetes bacterium]|nr:hypothetical protein [Planctomycetota bacterium]